MTDLSALIAEVPYYRYLGLRVTTDGVVVMSGGERHASEAPRIHGGILFALLEATAMLSLLATGSPNARTNDFTATFLRPAALSETMAEARPIRQGRRFAHLEVTAWQTDRAAPVAVGYGTWLLEL